MRIMHEENESHQTKNHMLIILALLTTGVISLTDLLVPRVQVISPRGQY